MTIKIHQLETELVATRKQLEMEEDDDDPDPDPGIK